jgi:hypothetical protein
MQHGFSEERLPTRSSVYGIEHGGRDKMFQVVDQQFYLLQFASSAAILASGLYILELRSTKKILARSAEPLPTPIR